MKYIPKGLINDIRNKYETIYDNCNFTTINECREIASKSIEKNAQIHSFKIEHPEMMVPFCVSRNLHKRDIRKGIKNIENAFLWGINNFNPEHFEESFIRELAGRITPELYDGKIAKYREEGTAILGASTTPPYPEKLVNYEIPWFMNSLKEQLSCTDVINRIETAIFAHLHIARIHPFRDGNGRTARTFQDVLLTHYGIPVPLIEAGERYMYYQCLDEAVLGWDERKAKGIKNGASVGEELFYNFMASKINSSFDVLSAKCNSKKGRACK